MMPKLFSFSSLVFKSNNCDINYKAFSKIQLGAFSVTTRPIQKSHNFNLSCPIVIGLEKRFIK